jgi:hypothetical protein
VRKKKLIVAAVSLALALLAADVALRWLVTPSDHAYGELFGVELPPHRVLPWARIAARPADPSSLPEASIVRGVPLTRGDLNGILREDPLLGHVPLENSASANGWWHANNRGARSSRDVAPQTDPGRFRVLVFGDSYAHGSRVRNEETWCSFLEERDERLEVWNFGVDGYGMGQAYLRYRQIAQELDYDLALLVFVPDKDLWRDVNTIRYLGERWDAYKVNPRFVVEDGRLRLVPSPYASLEDMLERNRGEVSEELRDHLVRYDRFYIPLKYEEVPLLGRSILFKRWLAARAALREQAVHEAVLRPGSEAQEVTREIFLAMARDAAEQDRRAAVVVLPSHETLRAQGKDPRSAEIWDATVRFVCPPGALDCFDLMEEFAGLPLQAFDWGYDVSHFGPKANRLIAYHVGKRIVEPALAREGPPG